MNFVLPAALRELDDAPALTLLARYFGASDRGYEPAVGVGFDEWDSLGTRAQDANRFTADDIVAVSFLSVYVPAPAAKILLTDQRGRFSKLLCDLGSDHDLADVETPLPDSWAGWDIMQALKSLPGVGQTTASKLLARKRPKLRPIWDSVVVEVTRTRQQQWEPVRDALRADGGALQRRLVHLRDSANLSPSISALRVLDVIAWREGKDRGL